MAKKRSTTSTKAKKVVRQRAAQANRDHVVTTAPMPPESGLVVTPSPFTKAAAAISSGALETL